LPLQRYIVDFAADVPFAAAQAKLREHHGVEVPLGAIRQVTLSHAKGLDERQILPKAVRGKAKVLIAEMDGSMIPTVQCTVREKEEQMEVQFGAQGSYLIDFYHLCEYLAAAAPSCSKTPKVWLEEQKTRFKSGRNAEVLAALKSHMEPEDRAEKPVHNALRYLSNRPGQFDYLSAIEAHLPIGSGEVESAHRYLIQKRLKLPGAWWRSDNAQAMLNLRSMRANQ
jgi:hypothetical protein